MEHHDGLRNARIGILCLLGLAIISAAQFGAGFSQGPNNRNVSVDTQVNVTGAIPEILLITVQNPITLSAGSDKPVECNITIRDYNGFGDLDTVNGTFYHSTSSEGAADNNNTKYTNTSCSPISGQQSGTFANYTCTFPVRYYALNGTWTCSSWVNDSVSLSSNNSNITNVSSLLALNVTTLIDYGQMITGDTSPDQEANVSNLGNVPINISVEGYARLINDGWGMVCEQGGNLTVNLQHFAANSTATFNEKQVLSQTPQAVSGLTIPKATNDSGSLNATYWQLFLDPAQPVFGVCNGTIVFQAESS